MNRLKKIIAMFLVVLMFVSSISLEALADCSISEKADSDSKNIIQNTTAEKTEKIPSTTIITENITSKIIETTANKNVEKSTEPTANKEEYESAEPKETTAETKKSIASVSAQTQNKTVEAGATQSTTVKYELLDVYNDDQETWSKSYVTYSYYTSGKTNSKYRYPNGTTSDGSNWYSGKVAQIVLVVGDTKCTWTCDEDTLKGNGGVDQGTGPLKVTRTTSDSSNLPTYYYGKKASKKDSSTKIEQIWAPWNGVRRNAANTAYVSALPHDKVTSIEFTKINKVSKYAFYGFCYDNGNLDSISFSGAMTSIGQYAFATNGVNAIADWGSVSTLGQAAFYNCDYLKKINFDNGKNISIANSDTSSDSSDSYGYTKGVFEGCEILSSINFGSAITTIGIKAFCNCDNLNTITWGSIKTIKAYAFAGCDGFSDGLNINGSSISTIENMAFNNCDGNFTKLTFNPGSMTSISGAYNSTTDAYTTIFKGCDNLKEINIGTNITKIGNYAFGGQVGNKYTINLGSTVTSIGKRAFHRSTDLKTVNFGTSPVTSIGEEAFRGCTALVQGKVNNTSPAMDGFSLSGTIDSSISSSNYNVFALPYCLKSLSQGAFRNCSSLIAVSFAKSDNNYTYSQLEKIPYNAFYNDYNLRFVFIPNSVTKIEGNYDSISDSYGAFALGSDTCKNYNIPVLYLGFSNNNGSKLAEIGDKAFMRTEITKNNSTNTGVRFYDRTNKKIIYSSDVLIFPSLTYIGYRAFFNNSSLSGILQFEQYVTISSRAFVNTNLTDLFFKWNTTRTTTDNITSSQIGASNQYVSNNDNMGYTDHSYSPPSGYYSLYTVLNDSTNGLFAIFAKSFENLRIGNNFNSWSAVFDSTETSDYSLPNVSYGNKNGDSTDNEEVQNDTITSTNTHSYLKTKAEWVTTNKKAKETVTFGYKNQQKVDFVFVVDNSPSMDKASISSDTNDLTEKGSSFKGANNTAKVMNEYAQIYDISKKVLPKSKTDEDGNTISILSFNGDENNCAENSCKTLGGGILNNYVAVYNALFKNDDGYNDGGVTNYSAGLSNAYLAVQELQKENPDHKQVVIMLTDGNPTYYDASKSTTAVSADSDGSNADASALVNGLDWAAAIRGSKNKNYSCRTMKSTWTSTSSNINTLNYLGLETPIYGILVGKTDSEALNAVTNGDKEKSPYVSGSEDLTELSTDLNNIIQSVLAETYTIVIPLNDNFVLDENSTAQIGTIEAYGSSMHSLKIQAGKFVSNGSYDSEYGLVKYDKDRNCIIWDLAPHPTSGFDSFAYTTYQLSFNLTCVGSGRMAEDDYKYYAVSDNDSSTSLNATSTIGSTLGTNQGAYVYLAPYTDDAGTKKTNDDYESTTYDPTENTKQLMNVAPALYLPYETGWAEICKYDEKGNTLGNAGYKVYDSDLNLVDLGNGYGPSSRWYDYKGLSNDASLVQSSYYQVTLYDMPVGTYYLFESEYPTTTDGLYTLSEKNEYVSIDVDIDNDGDKDTVSAIKFEITNNQGTSLNVYNKFISTTAQIRGTKYVMNGKNLVVDNVNGATIALYDNYNDAEEGNSNYLQTVLTDHNGTFFFNVSETGIYYCREIDTIPGLQISRDIKTVNVTDLNTDTAYSAGSIYDFKLGKIIIEADSSDNIQKGFRFRVTASSSDRKDTKVTIANSYNSSSGYNGFVISGLGSPVILSDSDGDGVYDNPSVSYRGKFNVDGSIELEVPFYNAYFSNGHTYYKGISYTVEEIGYETSTDIPDRYFRQEYGTSWSNVSPATSYTVSYRNWEGSGYDYYYPDFCINQTTNVCVYNPSIKVNIHNYDGDDKTPLQSEFTLGDEVLNTDSSGSATSENWFGYGDYSLTQTKVPEEYNLLSDSVNYNLPDTYQLIEDTTGQRYYYVDITVYNSKKTELPPSGGNGPLKFLIIGLITFSVSLGSFVILSYRKRKKGK